MMTSKHLSVLVVLAAALLLGVAGPVGAQITQDSALAGGPGDAPGFPVVITQPGTYEVVGPLMVTSANCEASSDFPGPPCPAIVITEDVHDVMVECQGATIEGPGPGVAACATSNKKIDVARRCAGIVLDGLNINVTIHGCHVTKFRDGILMRGGSRNLFSENIVEGNTDDGFQLEQSSNVSLQLPGVNHFVKNEVRENGDDGFDLERSVGNLFDGNTVTNNGTVASPGNGFALDVLSNNNAFIDNIIISNTKSGISFDDSNNNFFNSNTVRETR